MAATLAAGLLLGAALPTNGAFEQQHSTRRPLPSWGPDPAPCRGGGAAAASLGAVRTQDCVRREGKASLLRPPTPPKRGARALPPANVLPPPRALLLLPSFSFLLIRLTPVPCSSRRISSVLSSKGFYLPGVAPHDFQRGEKVELKVNKLTSTRTQVRGSREILCCVLCGSGCGEDVARTTGIGGGEGKKKNLQHRRHTYRSSRAITPLRILFYFKSLLRRSRTSTTRCRSACPRTAWRCRRRTSGSS